MTAQVQPSRIFSVYNAVSKMHDAYVYGYGCLGSIGRCVGSVGSWAWRRSKAGEVAKKVVSFPINASCSCVAWSVDKFRDAASLIRGRNEPVHGYFQSYSSTYESLEVEKAQRCFDLSVCCSHMADSPILIADIINKPVLEDFRHYLEMLRSRKTSYILPADVIEIQEIDKTIFEVDRLLDVLERQDFERNRETTAGDIQNFLEAINRKLLINFSIASGVENLGEGYGGSIMDYISGLGFLPVYLNPSVIAVAVGSNVGGPVGRVVGFSASAASSYFLLNHLFRFNSRAKAITVNGLVLTALMLMELYELNPASNYLKEFMGSQLSDFSYYSIGLLCNYLGMLVCNTGETLPDYVKKMTPAMIVYKLAGYLLEKGVGLNSILSGLTSFYLSHVAYNFDGYKSLFCGTLLDESLTQETLDSGMEIVERKLLQLGSEQMISETVSLFLKSIIQAGMEPMCEASEFLNQAQQLSRVMSLQRFHSLLSVTPEAMDCAQQVVHSWPLQALPASYRIENHHLLLHYLSQLSELCSVSSVSEMLTDAVQKEGSGQLSPLLQNLQTAKDRWLEIERQGPLAEVAFIVSQLNEFFNLIDTPEVSCKIGEYKAELMKVIGKSRLEGADFDRLFLSAQNKRISELRNELIQKIVKTVTGQEEINPIYSSLILSILDGNISPELFIKPLDMINKQLKDLLLLPGFTKEQSLCSAVTVDLLVKGFIILSSLNLSLFPGHCKDQMQPLDQEQLKTFTRNLIHFVFDTITPNKGVLLSAIERVARYETR